MSANGHTRLRNGRSAVEPGLERLVIPVNDYEDFRQEMLQLLLGEATVTLGSEVLLFTGDTIGNDIKIVHEALGDVLHNEPFKYRSLSVIRSPLLDKRTVPPSGATMIGFGGSIEGPRARRIVAAMASQAMLEADGVLDSIGGMRIPQKATGTLVL